MAQAAPAGRHYGMDWLRIGAFQLLILYHVGMAFVPWPYTVKMAPPIDWTVIPMFLTNPWRLSLLFVVSGYASAAMLARSRSTGAFLRQRLNRLGVPLLFGIAVIVVPQPWVELVTQHGYAHDFGWFVLHDYFRPQQIDGVFMPTYMHLWFVVYLIAYTALLALLMTLPAAWRSAGRRAAEKMLGGGRLIPLGIAYVYLIRGILFAWEDSHLVWADWGAHLIYLPMLLFGVLLQRSERLRGAIAAHWRSAGLLALTGYGLTVWMEIAWPGMTPLPRPLWPLHGLARATQGWAAIVGLIGLADTYANRDHRWRPMLAAAVFPLYIVHQTIIVVVGYWLLATPTGPLARFLILVAATAGGCWAFYLIGRSIRPLRPLIGLKALPRAEPVSRAALLV